MPKRKNETGPKPVLELTMAREVVESKIQERIRKAKEELKTISVSTREQYLAFRNEYYKWDSFNTEMLKRLFTTEELADEYSWFAGFSSSSMMDTPTIAEDLAELHRDIDQRIHRLDSIIERLELIPIAPHAATTTAADTRSSQATTNNRVFVVHGHDELAKANLEIFLTEIGLEPIVLHRQADAGLTIIEKFEKHSDVGYAFILLTADEMAYLRSEEAKSDSERKKEYRARPNVIFEFGYFVGKLGRSKVCCLHKGDVTLPSDVHGMIYKKFRESVEEVAFSIIKDLRASGYDIKMN